ncbi:globin domain-containing protein, partial [Anaerobiospirillum sp. NML120448]|uniref:globin domain-containing protein n=1 Tax=Anaerobiospirillum sp. NML120448 TaxID=2932816 RepID=UPI001FF661BA
MLTEKQIELIKSSVPFLQEHGVEITSIMYSQMLANNPEFRQIFNQGHQRTGRQQISLAAAVLAYAQNIENPTVLFNTVKHIASKHVSLNIRAKHYPIVGKHLLDAIEKVLGDQANDEILDAWAAAYAQLAEILIKTESELYEDCANSVGGWSGWRSFRISNKKKETEDVTSFILEPVD